MNDRATELLNQVSSAIDELRTLASLTRPTVIRTCRCENGHTFNRVVEHDPNSKHLTGERKPRFPQCGKGETYASPWRLLCGDKAYTLHMGDMLHNSGLDDPHK